MVKNIALILAAAAGLATLGCEESSTPQTNRPNTTAPAVSPGTSGLAAPERNRPEDGTKVRKLDNVTPPSTRDRPDPTKDADNTAQNKPDRDPGHTTTPMDQSNSEMDVELTGTIRRAVMADSGLSMTAKNCKIITDKSGRVTLRGPVNSRTEKDLIESYARNTPGVTWIDNMLEVKTP